MKANLALLVLILSSLSPLQGQEDALLEELNLFGVVATSNNPEFPSPVGFGVRSTRNLGHSWHFRLAYHRMTDESQKVGTICASYAPHIACSQDMTYSEMTLTGLRGGLLRTMVVGNHIRLGLGGGLSFNALSADNRGLGGERADLLAPKTSQVGYLALFSAEAIPFPGLPLRLTGGLVNHWVHFHTCSGSNPPQNDPFCTMATFQEAELGVSLAF
jgi:hypothetical protein